MKKSEGITLITLVITIIVLLILAGISIATLTGDNGVLKKANTAGEDTKKAEYKEILELIGNGLRPEKILENLNTEQFIDRYKVKIDEEIQKEETLKDASAEKRGKNSIIVITKEKYVFLVTENSVVCLGEQAGENPPDLTDENVEFIISSQGEWTNSDVSVTIKTDIEGYLLEYSIDGKNRWEIYDSNIIMKENGTIYARLAKIDGLGQVGGEIEKEINNIDKEKPTGTIEATSVKASSITVKVKAKDVEATEKNGCSGIKGYYYSIDGGSNYTEMKTEETYTFNDLEQTKEYNIVVKVEDNAGNQNEITINVKTTEQMYIIKNGEMLFGGPTIWSSYDLGTDVHRENNFLYCDLYSGSGAMTSIYWTVDVPHDNSTLYFSIDAPYIEHGYQVDNTGGFMFADVNLRDKDKIDETGMFKNRREIRPDGGHFNGAREFNVIISKKGRTYIGLQQYSRRGGMNQHTTFRIYNAWIE